MLSTRFPRPLCLMLLLATPALVTGCAADTCTQGDNMTDPRIVDGLEDADTGHQIRISWDAGTEEGALLPDAYFEAVQLEVSEELTNIVVSATATAAREITVGLAGMTTYLESEDALSFTLVFPDRRDFIDCFHLGMDDRYNLDATLIFTTAGALDQADLDQTVFLGAI